MKKHLIGLVACFAVAFAVQAQDPLTNGLIAFYPFSGNANDASGHGNNATPAGNYQFLPSNLLDGGAIRTIGDNSQYYSGGGNVLLPTFSAGLNSGFTLSLWVRDEVMGPVPAADTEDYISFGCSDLTALVICLHGSGSVIFGMNDYGTGVAAEFRMPINLQAYPASGWKHLVLAYQPGRFACYFNGQKLYETNATVNVFPVSQAAVNRHWWDNGSSSSARMSATYKNVRIYNRALSDSEVQSIFVTDLSPVLSIYTAIELEYPTQPGKVYTVQASPDLFTWTNCDVFLGTGDYWRKLYSTRSQGKLFYRVEVVQ
jgi:hypothetical protein